MDPDQRVVTIQRSARTSTGRIVEVNQITLPPISGNWCTDGPQSSTGHWDPKRSVITVPEHLLAQVGPHSNGLL